MKKIILLLIVSIFSCLVESSNEIQCEVTERRHWIDIGFTRLKPGEPRYKIFYACLFKPDVVISDPDTKLSNSLNENVTEIDNRELPGLEYLPTDIAEAFPEIKKIGFHQTSLKALSKKSFHGLFKLSYLSLSHNQIETIEEGTFDDLREIHSIYLHNNKLTSLPPKLFSNLESLDSLYLNDNQISSLDDDFFKNNRKLAILILNDNKFTNFAPEFFSSLVFLRSIWLFNNEISSLNSEWFKNSGKLETLNLEGNKFSEIPLDFTLSLNSLRSIYFSKNPLNSIDFGMFEKNRELTDVYFNGIKFTRVLNIDVVDKLPNLRGVSFEINDDSCIIGRYHEGTLNKLKEEVKENCKTE